MQELMGKVAVITGGASGIGREFARAFAAEGMKVVLADIDEAGMKAVSDELTSRGTEVLTMVCDSSLEQSVEALAEATLDRFGAVHVLCNNAGVVGKGDPWTGPISVWDWVVGINLYGVIHGVRSFLPIMQRQGEGHIVNTASVAGLMAVPGAAQYGVTKAAVVALSEGLYLELKVAGSPVNVTVVCPGFVRTNLMDSQVWPTQFGEEPPPSDNMLVQAMETFFRDGVNNGIDVTEVASQVVDAVRNDLFWVLTHEEMRQLPVERMQRAAAQENPVWTG